MKIPEWSGLKRVGSSYPSKLSVLLPFIGHIILFQEPVVTAFTNSYLSIGISQGGEAIRSSLFLIYYGLILFGLGSIMYYLFCPSVVSFYADKNNYIDKSIDNITSIELKGKLLDIEGRHHDLEVREQAIFHRSAISAGLSSEKNREVAVFVLSSYYDKVEQSYFLVRCSTFMFYTFGIALISTPSLIVLWKVTKKLLAF